MPTQFRSLVIANPNGAPIHLGDVADVQDSVENLNTGSWYDGKQRHHPRHPAPAGCRTPVEVVDAINAKLPALHAEIPASVSTQRHERFGQADPRRHLRRASSRCS